MSEEREPAADLYTRLLIEAEAGQQCEVSGADALEFRRDQYGLNARAFASILGTTPSRYSDIVNQRRAVPKSVILRAIAIGVPALPLLIPPKNLKESNR